MRREYVLGTYSDDLGQRHGLVVELRSDGAAPVIALVERPSADSSGGLGSQRTVSVPLSSLGEILPYFERRLGLAHAKPDTDPMARYVTCVTALAGQEKHRELSDVTGITAAARSIE